VIYLDSSALMKLVVGERESEALDRHLAVARHRGSCLLARVEVTRGARKRGPATLERGRVLLDLLELIAIDSPLLVAAAELEDDRLRSLDALHVAAALSLGDDLHELITYDRRMAAAAEDLGLPVFSPA